MELQEKSKKLILELDELFNTYPSRGALIGHNTYSIILGNYAFENKELFIYTCDKMYMDSGYYVTYHHSSGDKYIVVKDFIVGWEILPFANDFSYSNIDIDEWIEFHKCLNWDICNEYLMESALK